MAETTITYLGQCTDPEYAVVEVKRDGFAPDLYSVSNKGMELVIYDAHNTVKNPVIKWGKRKNGTFYIKSIRTE